MLSPQEFCNCLTEVGIRNAIGVPDSLMKGLCNYFVDPNCPLQHTITANEGGAISLAAGKYIAEGVPSIVYFQNSGFGNSLNPLLSLADKQVYGIPMIVLVGWRGEPGVKDEPQHMKQGEVMEDLLLASKIPHLILCPDENNIRALVKQAFDLAVEGREPVIILVRKGVFDNFSLTDFEASSLPSREEAIKKIVSLSEANDIFVSTTGMASRELYEVRDQLAHGHGADFLTVGSMGHANMIAMGIAEGARHRRVLCIDGDGAMLMHMGNIAIIGNSSVANFTHIVLNNGAHDSVGGQPTVGFNISMPEIAMACGYQKSTSVASLQELEKIFPAYAKTAGPNLIEVRVSRGARKDLGRPLNSPAENLKELKDNIVGRS